MSIAASYVGVIVIWSTTPLTIQWGGQGGGLLFGVALRMALGAAVAIVPLAILRMRLPLDRHAVQAYFAAALGIFGAMTSTYWGAQYVPSGLDSY